MVEAEQRFINMLSRALDVDFLEVEQMLRELLGDDTRLHII